MNRAGIVRLALAAAVLAAGSTVRGTSQAASPQNAAANAASVSASHIVTTGTVVGLAANGDATPYPQPRVRLRNLETGRGDARTVGDAEGRFRFNDVKPGIYVAELLSNGDKVLAVGDLFSVTAGGQAETVVRLTAKAPWYGGFFGNAAAAVIAAASSLGVTASGPGGRPVSPQ
jgi:hypothetical protein